MEMFCIALREDIRQRWTQGLGQPLAVVEADHPGGLPDGGLGIVHWQSLSTEQREYLLAHIAASSLRLIVLSDLPGREEGIELLRRGVRGYGNTFVTDSLLREMVAAVTRGDVWAGPDLLQVLLQQLLEQVVPRTHSVVERYGLSEREQEVLHEVMSGASNKIVARRLDITERTVKAHMSAILSKTGAHDRVELILLAQRAEREVV
jgi:DNA-binding NarL/FixJ family response regulator